MTLEQLAARRAAVVRRRFGLRVAMRDGVRLATDLHFPAGGPSGGPYPALLARTPYGRQLHTASVDTYTAAGYVVAHQDVRGRGDSDGEWIPFAHEGRDGYDTIEWLAEQEWCNRSVGTVGGSYPGYVQWAAARECPPHLRAMSVSVPAGRFGQQEMYNHGVLFLGCLSWVVLTADRTLQHCALADWSEAFWHLPVRTMDAAVGRDLPWWRELTQHPALDEWWLRHRLSDLDFAKIDLPVLHVTGWFDSNLTGTLFYYDGMLEHSPARDRQALVIGPWDHGGAGSAKPPLSALGEEFPELSSIELDAIRIAWLDRWLKPASAAGSPTESVSTRVYVTGAHRWTHHRTWPPAERTAVSWYLRGSGELTGTPPDGDVSRSYRYDPEDPVILVRNWDFYGAAADATVPPSELGLARDELARREDVLAYTSDPLDAPLEVAGTPRVELYAQTDGPDTDWFVWLTDVGPDGRSIQVASGMLRGRFHDSLHHESLLEPNRPYLFDIELTPLAHDFPVGHRIQLIVSSSNFPIYDRNPNTGEPAEEAVDLRVALNTVHHDAARPSRVLLPTMR